MEQIERVCTDLSLKNNVKSLIRVIYESINIVLWQFVFIFVAHSKNLVNMNKFVSKLLLAIALQLIVCNFSFSQRGANWQVIPYASNVFKVIYHPFEYTREFNVTNAVIAKALGIDNPTFKINRDASITINNGALTIHPAFAEDGSRGLRFDLQKDEMIFGGGERALPMNRRGYRFNLYNQPNYAYGVGAENLNYSIPFFISNKSYAIFFDNGSKGYADIGKKDSTKFEAVFESGEINAYIIFGKTYQEILSSYHKLTGYQPLPPRWAMGNLMSRFGYTSQAQATGIVKQMKDEKIPVDAIIFDLFWFGDSIKGYLGNLDWVNKEKWTDPNKMMADFKKQNINTMLITEPYILQYTNAYNESLDYQAKNVSGNPFVLQDFYFGKGGLVDIFRKDAGQWVWNYHYKKQIKNGVAAWWTDLGEPERHPENMYHDLKDLGINKPILANEVHNIYGHYWNKMLFENYAKEYPSQRLFHLNRSGFAGSQRYSIFPWSGDVGRTWSGLQAQLPVMLGMSMCGVPYIHADAGGFAGGQQDGELYVRWLQFAAYTPIFRPHGTALNEWDASAVSFPSEAALMEEPYKSFAKQVVLERYKMLPYNYTLAYRNTKFGEPLVKPLMYNYISDSIAIKTEDEYLFGDHILVAPVLKREQTARTVYLPKGFWFDVESNKMYKGNEFVEMNVTEYKKPLFYKEGSFIPQYECNGENTVEINRAKLKIVYVPSAQKSTYEMYDDDGENKNALAQNQYELIKFSSIGKTDKALSINMSSNNGTYKNKPSERNISLTIPAIETQPKTVAVNGKMVTNFVYINNTIIIPVTLKSTAVKVDVKW
jgi:oligosaccharide 4-alpha-D-glucosyltransferase